MSAEPILFEHRHDTVRLFGYVTVRFGTCLTVFERRSILKEEYGKFVYRNFGALAVLRVRGQFWLPPPPYGILYKSKIREKWSDLDITVILSKSVG